MDEHLMIEAGIDGRTFSEYAFFDVMRRQKRWLRPLIFALIFTAFGILVFFWRGKDSHAPLLCGVLFGIGIFLPLVYLLSFFFSVRRQSRVMNADQPAYTLVLEKDALSVIKGGKTHRFAWSDLYAAHRLKYCICLYIDARRVFLLPRACGEERFDAAWRMIRQHMLSKTVWEHKI